MATTDRHANEFVSTVAGVTVRGQAHSLSAWFVLGLRLTMGIVFLWSGVDKILEGSWTAAGYLTGATVANGSPLADLFVWMGHTDWMLSFIDIAVPWGELLIGLGLIVGVLTRLAAFFGAVMMVLFYFGNWDIAHGYINSDFAYMLVFLSVAAFGAGRILGLDRFIEQYPIGGVPLVERYPVLTYILG